MTETEYRTKASRCYYTAACHRTAIKVLETFFCPSLAEHALPTDPSTTEAVSQIADMLRKYNSKLAGYVSKNGLHAFDALGVSGLLSHLMSKVATVDNRFFATHHAKKIADVFDINFSFRDPRIKSQFILEPFSFFAVAVAGTCADKRYQASAYAVRMFVSRKRRMLSIPVLGIIVTPKEFEVRIYFPEAATNRIADILLIEGKFTNYLQVDFRMSMFLLSYAKLACHDK